MFMDTNSSQNSQVELKPWFRSHPILIGVCIVVALLMLLASANSHKTSTNTSAQASPSGSSLPTSSASSSSSSNSDTYSFTTTTIQDLVQTLDKNAQSGNTGFPTGAPPLVEVTGKVVQKATFQYTLANGSTTPPNDFIKVEDSKGYTVLLSLDPTMLGFKALYNQTSVGDNVLIRGAAGSTQCDNAPDVKDFCDTLNLTQINVPILVAMEPMPEGGNKAPLELEGAGN
jgi:hypothetical protein